MCTVQFDQLLILVFTQLESAMAWLLSLTVGMTVIQLIYSTCQVACTVRFVSECIVHIRQGGHQGGNHNCHLPSCWCWCWWTHLRREAGEAHLVRQSQTSSQVPLLLWFTCSWEVWASELQSRRRDQAMDLWSPPVLMYYAAVHGSTEWKSLLVSGSVFSRLNQNNKYRDVNAGYHWGLQEPDWPKSPPCYDATSPSMQCWLWCWGAEASKQVCLILIRLRILLAGDHLNLMLFYGNWTFGFLVGWWCDSPEYI